MHNLNIGIGLSYKWAGGIEPFPILLLNDYHAHMNRYRRVWKMFKLINSFYLRLKYQDILVFWLLLEEDFFDFQRQSLARPKVIYFREKTFSDGIHVNFCQGSASR